MLLQCKNVSLGLKRIIDAVFIDGSLFDHAGFSWSLPVVFVIF